MSRNESRACSPVRSDSPEASLKLLSEVATRFTTPERKTIAAAQISPQTQGNDTRSKRPRAELTLDEVARIIVPSTCIIARPPNIDYAVVLSSGHCIIPLTQKHVSQLREVQHRDSILFLKDAHADEVAAGTPLLPHHLEWTVVADDPDAPCVRRPRVAAARCPLTPPVYLGEARGADVAAFLKKLEEALAASALLAKVDR